MLEIAYLSFKKSKIFWRGHAPTPRPLYTARTFRARLGCLRILVTGLHMTFLVDKIDTRGFPRVEYLHAIKHDICTVNHWKFIQQLQENI